MTLALSTRDTLEARATLWASMPDDALKREAAHAANARDIERLWGLCEAFLSTKSANRTSTSPNTIKAYRRGVLDLLEHWPHENLLRPTRNAPDLYVVRLMGADLKPGTIAVKIGAAKLLYKTLRWSGATAVDPFGDVRAPKDDTPAWEKRKPYTFEEIQAMRAKARPVDHALLLLGAHAGLRVAEMVDLLWSDVDLSAGTLRVRHGKGGKPRTVHLSPGMIRALEALPHNNARVLGFTSTSRARARMRRLTFRALVPYRGIHALRHSCGTRMARELGLEAAQHHLGHANLATTQVYAKWSDTQTKDAVGGWE